MGDGESRRGWFLPVLLGLLALALVAGAVVQLRDRGDDPPEPLRPVDLGAGEAGEPEPTAVEAVVVARSAVQAFYGLDHRTLEADLEEVRQLATGDFAEQYDAAVDGLRRRVLARRLVTTATLVPDGTATASLTTAHAEVLVAVDVVRRAAGEPTERRDYRTRVELRRVDGAWLVSALEPV
jgi:Mce-associated membrane protein